MRSALVLLAASMPQPAHAQHADAGVEHPAAALPPAAPPAEPPPSTPPDSPAASHEGSGELPKLIDPSQLSESTRARLAERAAGRHPSSLPVQEPAPRHEPPHEAAPRVSSVPPYRPRVTGADTLRRGHARMRVQAVEMDKGVTLLSNRIQLQESRISAAVAKRPLPDPEPPVVEEPIAAADLDRSNVTETHSLRPASSRAPKAKNTGTGLGWLLWPFILFVTSGAVVGTLWFRKKTE